MKESFVQHCRGKIELECLSACTIFIEKNIDLRIF